MDAKLLISYTYCEPDLINIALDQVEGQAILLQDIIVISFFPSVVELLCYLSDTVARSIGMHCSPDRWRGVFLPLSPSDWISVTWAEQCWNVCCLRAHLQNSPLIETRSAAVADWQQVTGCVCADPARHCGAATLSSSAAVSASPAASASGRGFPGEAKGGSSCFCDVDFLSTPSLI